MLLVSSDNVAVDRSILIKYGTVRRSFQKTSSTCGIEIYRTSCTATLRKIINSLHFHVYVDSAVTVRCLWQWIVFLRPVCCTYTYVIGRLARLFVKKSTEISFRNMFRELRDPDIVP
jgi:hypothetical protein